MEMILAFMTGRIKILNHSSPVPGKGAMRKVGQPEKGLEETF